MSELTEIYAACLVEYAGRQPDGALAGPFYTFGKDARDAFNLPYNEKVFKGAFSHLTEIGCLKEYRTWGVETYYKLSSKDFARGMEEVALGVRRFQTSNHVLAASNAATAAGSSLQPRSPTILESYADLGSGYLAQVLDSYEKHIQNLADDEMLSDEEREEANASDPLQGIVVPASDRIVRLSHNETIEMERPTTTLVEALERDNGDEESAGFRERILGQIKAGRELIRAGEFRAYLLYQTLLTALGELISKHKNPSIVELARALLGVLVGSLFQS
jgi:hypothetical protein